MKPPPPNTKNLLKCFPGMFFPVGLLVLGLNTRYTAGHTLDPATYYNYCFDPITTWFDRPHRLRTDNLRIRSHSLIIRIIITVAGMTSEKAPSTTTATSTNPFRVCYAMENLRWRLRSMVPRPRGISSWFRMLSTLRRCRSGATTGEGGWRRFYARRCLLHC